LQGLEGSHGLEDYAEDYLAFLYVEEEHGVGALHALAGDVVEGRGDYRAAIRARTGEDWPAFRDNARRHAHTKLRLIEKGIRLASWVGYARYQERDYAAAAAAFNAFLAAHPDAYCAGLARYYRAKCDWLRGRWEDAEAGFRAVTGHHAREVGLVSARGSAVRAAGSLGRAGVDRSLGSAGRILTAGG